MTIYSRDLAVARGKRNLRVGIFLSVRIAGSRRKRVDLAETHLHFVRRIQPLVSGKLNLRDFRLQLHVGLCRQSLPIGRLNGRVNLNAALAQRAHLARALVNRRNALRAFIHNCEPRKAGGIFRLKHELRRKRHALRKHIAALFEGNLLRDGRYLHRADRRVSVIRLRGHLHGAFSDGANCRGAVFLSFLHHRDSLIRARPVNGSGRTGGQLRRKRTGFPNGQRFGRLSKRHLRGRFAYRVRNLLFVSIVRRQRNHGGAGLNALDAGAFHIHIRPVGRLHGDSHRFKHLPPSRFHHGIQADDFAHADLGSSRSQLNLRRGFKHLNFTCCRQAFINICRDDRLALSHRIHFNNVLALVGKNHFVLIGGNRIAHMRIGILPVKGRLQFDFLTLVQRQTGVVQ